MKINRFHIAPDKVNKTTNLLLYICQKLKDEKTFGSTVLNKVLYFVDNLWYQTNGEPISGFKYIKQTNGPTPMPKQFLALRDHLIATNQLVVEDRKYFGRLQKVHKPLVSPNLEDFGAEEIALIDDVINEFKDTNGTHASLISHQILAWKIADPMEELPFHSFLLTEADLTEADIEWALKSIHERNSAAA